ncbi:hypothetical protein LIER_10964 [Lithospermum erythrorhizon]|uniref:Uncharacterized protein n=1 Tax=Lithospermum erythrorhizon TaxID=34254 RepID=A0AAV3PP44_LITER
MEKKFASQYGSPDPQASGRDGYMKESRRLGYQLKCESLNVSNSDSRSKMVSDASNFPSRSSELLQKQQDNEKERHNEELVRYMSNLPSFLKNDVKLDEKAFSVGVLDWKILEKWQHFHNIGNKNISVHSGVSSRPSAGRSSSRSSSYHSLSPARQKPPYPTLQSHFYGTASENRSQDTESSEVNKLKNRDRKPVPSGLSGVQQTAIRTDLPSDQKAEYRVKTCKAEDLNVVKSSVARKSQSLEDAREKLKSQDFESLRRHEMMRTSLDHYTADEIYARKQENPRYEHGNKYPQIRRSLNLTDTKKIGSKNASDLKFPSSDKCEASCAELFPNMPPSCPPREADPRHPRIKEPFSGAYQDNKITNDLIFRRFSDSGDASVNAWGMNLHAEKSIPAVEDQVVISSSSASNTKTVSLGTTKIRNPSPTKRFGFSLSTVGKVSSSSAALAVSQSSLRNPIGTSRADEVAISSSSLNNSKVNSKTVSSGTTKIRNPSPTKRFGFSLSTGGKVSSSSAALAVSQSSSRNPIGTSGGEEVAISSPSLNNSKVNNKGRSSPLRRLLEPLMRPARASPSDSRLHEPASKSSAGHGESTAHSVKLKLDLKSCKNVEAEVPHCSSNHSSPTVQALLQVAVRNGFPLFTFAVDNKNDILAATMRKPISVKEDFSCIYSFYIVQELKKKNGGWINHGKDKGNNLVPNIVAQMKVTDSFKQNSLDHSISKEYVLFSYDTKQAETSDHELNDELAAVVVKIPNKSTIHRCQNYKGYENSDDTPTPNLNITHSLSSLKCNSGSGDIGENQNEDQLSMTVILPGGRHGQPIKGEPSSLITRWHSGGSCDCGGWDLGCRMRILTDNAQSRQRSSSAKPKHANKLLELFSQDEGQAQKPAFSLAPFKDGIYAVEFNSSIEILQAFSISLSILSCFKPVEFVETSNGLEDKASADNTVSETGGRKVYAKIQTKVPAFISNPPLSPVGRV